ncbi:uncharacterized protein At4g04775-like [Salvia splendens]|uniref:uncharacterized protein At4g04775-like n=1 Tax=Salvia splendens TaxID=180675 RepID=UPI001C258957|nr:uncharacterized protein At4g04775-like [Salvia splendens]
MVKTTSFYTSSVKIRLYRPNQTLFTPPLSLDSSTPNHFPFLDSSRDSSTPIGSENPVTRMSSSSQHSSRTWPRFEAVVCDHGLEADVVTSNTDANPGRRFYRCQVWKEDDCKFFRWIDPSLSPNQEYFFKKLKLDRDNVQRALRDRVAKQDALDESVRSKTVEVEALQGVVAQLQRQNRNLKVVICMLCIVLWILL